MAYNKSKDATIETLGAIGIGIAIFALLQLMIFLKRIEVFTLLLLLGNIVSIAAYALFFKMKSVYIFVLGGAVLFTLVCTSLLAIKGVLSPLQIILTLINFVVFLLSFEMKLLPYIKSVEDYKKSDV